MKPYVEASAVLHPIIKIDRLYTNEITAELDEFKSYVFGELLYFTDGTVCLNAGYATDAIILTI